jgi:alpha,alpha-trehalase
VTCLGCAGGGGEYEVVVGFGWTNGVILDFLKKYGMRMVSPQEPKQNGASSSSISMVVISMIIPLLSVIKVSLI